MVKRPATRKWADYDIDGQPCRVGQKINNMAENIRTRQAEGKIKPDDLTRTHKALDMEFEEHFRFQELKSLAFTHGKLTEVESLMVYELLGNTVDHFNKQPVEVKAVLSALFVELLQWARSERSVSELRKVVKP